VGTVGTLKKVSVSNGFRVPMPFQLVFGWECTTPTKIPQKQKGVLTAGGICGIIYNER
jgi:hypothetical protein